MERNEAKQGSIPYGGAVHDSFHLLYRVARPAFNHYQLYRL
jgi:hypothetical protein